jgi:two-component system cell cycle response regulator DivK
LNAKLLRNVDQVGLMRLQKANQGGEKAGLTGARAKLLCIDSGQVEETLSPPLIAERCCKRAKGNGEGVVWTWGVHDLRYGFKAEGSELAKILIVEDNALNIKLFCDLLAAHGHEPEAVTDSRNALEAARRFSPDLVITDIQLPHISGLDLIEMIRADDALRTVPVMAVTAYSAPGDEERIRAAGAQAYVSKPISVAKFAQTVEDLLHPPAEGARGDASGAA